MCRDQQVSEARLSLQVYSETRRDDLGGKNQLMPNYQAAASGVTSNPRFLISKLILDRDFIFGANNFLGFCTVELKRQIL